MHIPRLALLFCAFLTMAAAADRLQQTLALMDQAAVSFKGLTADIAKVTYRSAITEREEEKGTIAVRRPKPKDLQMLMDIKEPDPQQFQLLARTARVYNPKTRSGQEYALGKYGSVVNEYMLLGFGSSPRDLQQAFTIGKSEPDPIGGRKATRIELTPRKPDTAIHLVRADLWISDETGIALQQKLYTGAEGDYFLFTYSNMKLADVPESAVALDAPRNIKWEHPLK
jgi:outer membrane lipoprotein-sorting protein